MRLSGNVQCEFLFSVLPEHIDQATSRGSGPLILSMPLTNLAPKKIERKKERREGRREKFTGLGNLQGKERDLFLIH